MTQSGKHGISCRMFHRRFCVFQIVSYQLNSIWNSFESVLRILKKFRGMFRGRFCVMEGYTLTIWNSLGSRLRLQKIPRNVPCFPDWFGSAHHWPHNYKLRLYGNNKAVNSYRLSSNTCIYMLFSIWEFLVAFLTYALSGIYEQIACLHGLHI